MKSKVLGQLSEFEFIEACEESISAAREEAQRYDVEFAASPDGQAGKVCAVLRAAGIFYSATPSNVAAGVRLASQTFVMLGVDPTPKDIHRVLEATVAGS